MASATTTKDRVVSNIENANYVKYPVKNGETIYQGRYAIVVDGYLYDADATSVNGGDRAVLPMETLTATADGAIDSSGNATNSVLCYDGGEYFVSDGEISGLTQADLLKNIYVSDNQTLTLTSTNMTLLGTIKQFFSATKILIAHNA